MIFAKWSGSRWQYKSPGLNDFIRRQGGVSQTSWFRACIGGQAANVNNEMSLTLTASISRPLAALTSNEGSYPLQYRKENKPQCQSQTEPNPKPSTTTNRPLLQPLLPHPRHQPQSQHQTLIPASTRPSPTVPPPDAHPPSAPMNISRNPALRGAIWRSPRIDLMEIRSI